jgi:hypothetical protein
VSKTLPEKLPDSEWNFNFVPDEEIWACLIWEYGRSTNWIHGLFPDYGSTADVVQRLRDVSGPNVPDSLTCLHRMLYELCTRNLDLMRAKKMFHGSEAAVTSKYKTIGKIGRMILTSKDHKRLLGLVGELSARQASRLIKVFRKRKIFGVQFNRIFSSYRRRVIRAEYLCPFPRTPWLALKGDDRTAMCLALRDDPGMILHLRADNSHPPPSLYAALTNEDEKRKTSSTGKAASERGIFRHFVRGPGLRDITEEILSSASDVKSVIMGLRGEIAADQGLFGVLFRINWKLNDQELMHFFQAWLKCRPLAFKSYAKHRRKTTQGPMGFEITFLNGKKIIKAQPDTALSCLGSWRKLEAAGTQKQVVAFYHPQLFGKKYQSKVSSYSRECARAEHMLDQLFPKAEN